MPITVTELIGRVREYADARDDGDDPYISDAAIMSWLTQENRRLVRRIGRLGYAWGETSVAFTQSTTLSDVVAITGVYEVAGNQYRPVPRLAEGAAYDASRRFWRVTKSALGVVTVSVGEVGSWEVRYIPAPGPLTDASSVYYTPGWEEILVLGAALRAKAKEGSDGESPLLRQLYQDEWDDIEVEAANSDARTVVRAGDSEYPLGLGVNQSAADWTWWWA